MTPQQHCIYCGSPAEEIVRVAHTMDCTEITYRCTDSRCQGITTGTLTLRRSGLPASGYYLHPEPPRPEGEISPGSQVQFFKAQP